MLLKKKKISPKTLLIVGLIANIIFLTLLQFLEDYLGINPIEVKDSEKILDNIASFSIFVILVAPIMEELLYRLPMKKNKYAFISLLIGIIYILIFKILALKIILFVYLTGLGYAIFSKKEPSLIFVILSILIFIVSHVENYDMEEIKLLNIAGYVFQFMPQLVLGIMTSYLRLKISFNYALIYHILYNASILTMSILFEL